MKRDEKNVYFNQIIGAITFSVCAAFFAFFYIRQETNKSNKLDECSFYTIMTPLRMPDSHKMYFNFIYNKKLYNSSTSLGGDDVGLHWSNEEILNTHYWIQVYCNDFKINRVVWKVPVPDTLQFIPNRGWEKIPYHLSE